MKHGVPGRRSSAGCEDDRVPQDQPGPAFVAEARVRAAEPSDAAAVGQVQAASWREAYAGLLAPDALARFDPDEMARAWRRSLEAPPTLRHHLLVACAGSKVVGFAAVGPCADPDQDERVTELLVLGVHPEARAAGHGSRLLQAAVDTARTAGSGTLVVWVPRDHEPTRAFFQRAGMVPDSAWRDRGVDEAGHTLREVRLAASLADSSTPGDSPSPREKD